MKIVVASGIGIQNDINNQIIYYSGVPNNYNLSGLIDVTSFATLTLFNQIRRLNYTGYRDSVNRYWNSAYTGNWNATETSNKKILAQLFLVDSGNRAEVLKPVEIDDWIKTFVCENAHASLCNKADILKNASVATLDSKITSGNADAFDKYDKTGGPISGDVIVSGDLMISGLLHFKFCKRDCGSIYMTGNAVETTFNGAGSYRLCSGTMISGLINHNFSLSNKELQYNGQNAFTGFCAAIGSLGGQLIGLDYSATIFKNGAIHNNATVNGAITTRPGNFSLNKPITLVSGDKVGVAIKNNTSSDAIIVTDLDINIY